MVTKMKKYAYLAVIFMLAASLYAADVTKLPSDIGVRIRNIQLDQARLQNTVAQLQQQYASIQQSLIHDQQELDSLKTEALGAAKLDATWDVDLDKLEFVAKPKPTPAPAAPTVKK